MHGSVHRSMVLEVTCGSWHSAYSPNDMRNWRLLSIFYPLNNSYDGLVGSSRCELGSKLSMRVTYSIKYRNSENIS